MDADHMMRNKCPCSIVINHIFSYLIVYKDIVLQGLFY